LAGSGCLGPPNPRNALPALPRWLWLVLLLGNLAAVFSSRPPHLEVGSVSIGVGGLLNVLRFTVLSLVLLGLAAMVSWTTNVAQVAPAIATWAVPCDDSGFRSMSGPSGWGWPCGPSRC
jgi:energy-coupling factor transport system permease protein